MKRNSTLSYQGQNVPLAALAQNSGGIKERLIPALLIVLTLGTMAPLFTADFTNWDDRNTIVDNKWLNPPSWDHLAHAWDPRPPVYMDIYIPLTYSVWSAVAAVSYVPVADPETRSHLNPWMFHGVNVLVHVCGVLLVFAILKLLVRRPWVAAAGAVLYAVHPVQVEPVAWTSGLKDVLCGCMGLLAIWQYILFALQDRCDGGRAAETQAAMQPATGGSFPLPVLRGRVREGAGVDEQPPPQPSPGVPGERDKGTRRLSYARRLGYAYAETLFHPWRSRHYLVAIIAFVLAMLAKPSGIVVPLLVIVIDQILIRRPLIRTAASILPWLLLVIPFVLIGRFAQPGAYLTYVTPLVYRPLIALDSLAFYLYKLIFPLHLTITYGRRPAVVIAHHWYAYTWIAPIAVLVALWIWRKNKPWLIAAVGVYWLAVLPVLGLVPFDFQSLSTVADHYLYLAMLGPAIGVAFLLQNVRQKWIGAAVVVVLVVLATRSFLQAQTWKNAVTLYSHAIGLNPTECGPYDNLGVTYEDQHNYGAAITTFTDGLKHSPHCVQIECNLAMLLGNDGKLDEAERLFIDAKMHVPRHSNQQKLIEDGLAEVARARAQGKTSFLPKKTGQSEPHLTPTGEPIQLQGD